MLTKILERMGDIGKKKDEKIAEEKQTERKSIAMN